jgi:hypothetical protein
MKYKIASIFRIDESVFLSMALIAVLSLFTLAFRYHRYEPCKPVKFVIASSDFHENSPISFKAEVIKDAKYVWDFGDSTEVKHSSSFVTHRYNKPGTYTVILSINGNCVPQIQTIHIKEAPLFVNNDLQPKFTVPDEGFVNEKVTFTDNTPGAASWEWRFGETQMVDARTKSPSYRYLTPGTKLILLKINGRSDMVGFRTIHIKELKKNEEVTRKKRNSPNNDLNIPEVPVSGPIFLPTDTVIAKPEKPTPKPPDISTAQMSSLFDAVVTGDKKASDFSIYLCGNLNMQVTYNGSNMTFSQMCDELRKEKKKKNIHKPRVEFTKYESTGCIIDMKVSVAQRTAVEKLLGTRN